MGGHSSLVESATASGFDTLGDVHVLQVTDTDTSLLALVMGAGLGLASALLLVVIATPLAEVAPSIWPLGVLLAGWLLSAWYIARQTTRLLVVLRRGFLVGAVEWLLLVLTGRPLPVAEASTGTTLLPVVDPQIVAAVSGTPGTVMLWVCIGGLLLTSWLTRRPPVVARARAA